MERSRRFVASGLLLLPLLLLLPRGGYGADGFRFTRYNIHCQDKRGLHASYSGWIDPGESHVILPPNTQVALEDSSRKELEIKLKDGRELTMDFHADRMKMGAEEYFKLITSPQPVSLDALSGKDREGVKEGKASPGMSKNGVLAALGYPPVHATPSLAAKEWIYWKNRFNRVRVEFDGDRVRAVVD